MRRKDDDWTPEGPCEDDPEAWLPELEDEDDGFYYQRLCVSCDESATELCEDCNEWLCEAHYSGLNHHCVFVSLKSFNEAEEEDEEGC